MTIINPSMIFVILFILAAAIVPAIIKKQKYRELGELPGARLVEDFGFPEKTLYTSTKVLTLHHLITITNEDEEVVYRSETKFPSIHDKTDVVRWDGTPVAHIERKLLTLREVHYVTMADGTGFELSNEILHIVRDVTNVIGLGWRIDGNILQLNFVIRDENEDVVAVIGQKFLSIHDKYSIDIYQPEHEETVVAILVALQHMIRDREAASSGASGNGNTSSN